MRVIGYYLENGSIFELYSDKTDVEIMSNINPPERAQEVLSGLEKRLKRKDQIELKTITKKDITEKYVFEYQCPYCGKLSDKEGVHPSLLEEIECLHCNKMILIDYED